MIAELKKVFSRVRSKQREAERDQFQTYWEIVARLAHGESLDEGALVDAALAAGRDADQMANDVELYQHRERLARELAEAPVKKREAEKLARQIEAKSRELAEIQQRLETEIAALYQQKRAFEDAATATAQHRTELINSAPNPAHREALEGLSRNRRDLIADRARLKANALDAPQGIRQSLLAQIENLDERLAATDAEAEAIRETMLIP